MHAYNVNAGTHEGVATMMKTKFADITFLQHVNTDPVVKSSPGEAVSLCDKKTMDAHTHTHIHTCVHERTLDIHV